MLISQEHNVVRDHRCLIYQTAYLKNLSQMNNLPYMEQISLRSSTHNSSKVASTENIKLMNISKNLIPSATRILHVFSETVPGCKCIDAPAILAGRQIAAAATTNFWAWVRQKQAIVISERWEVAETGVYEVRLSRMSISLLVIDLSVVAPHPSCELVTLKYVCITKPGRNVTAAEVHRQPFTSIFLRLFLLAVDDVLRRAWKGLPCGSSIHVLSRGSLALLNEIQPGQHRHCLYVDADMTVLSLGF